MFFKAFKGKHGGPNLVTHRNGSSINKSVLIVGSVVSEVEILKSRDSLMKAM